MSGDRWMQGMKPLSPDRRTEWCANPARVRWMPDDSVRTDSAMATRSSARCHLADADSMVASEGARRLRGQALLLEKRRIEASVAVSQLHSGPAKEHVAKTRRPRRATMGTPGMRV